MKRSRRRFIKQAVVGGVGLSFSMSAKSYGSILGANDRLNFAVVGANSRGLAHIKAIAATTNTTIGYLCDVDTRVLQNAGKMIESEMGAKAENTKDIRKLLERKDVDVITIATPDHWHAPMAIMGAQAGKHVYVEKPCSHNPNETELLIAAQKKYGVKIQMGNQQRSGKASIEAIKDIRDGLIGKPYFGKAWYSNARKSIGVGRPAPVPDWLDWDLWQGPAPRKDFRDNVVHYNWHWFWHWGTGEVHNNGTHEIDICRWALGVDYPAKVTYAGGRFHFNDDWEFDDTQVISYEFTGGKMITWESKSCNPFQYHERGRGVTIHGEKGTVLLDRNSYLLFDLNNKLIKEFKESEASGTLDARGEGVLDVYHMQNLADGIRNGTPLNADIKDAGVSTQLCHYGNLAKRAGGVLAIDPATGRVQGANQLKEFWSRDYAKGWEIKM